MQETNRTRSSASQVGAAEAVDYFLDHCGAAVEGVAADVLVGLMGLSEVAGAAD